jgi:hypothetical protein
MADGLGLIAVGAIGASIICFGLELLSHGRLVDALAVVRLVSGVAAFLLSATSLLFTWAKPERRRHVVVATFLVSGACVVLMFALLAFLQLSGAD